MGRLRTANYIFNGAGRSFRAEVAEDEGKLPLTRAIPRAARILGKTQKYARWFLTKILCPCEWHHTGKYARRTDYYNVAGIAELTANDIVSAAYYSDSAPEMVREWLPFAAREKLNRHVLDWLGGKRNDETQSEYQERPRCF